MQNSQSKQIESNNLKIIKDQMAAEHLLNKKYNMYSSQCSDSQIKTLCNEASQIHKNNFSSLKKIIKKNREILGHYYKRTDDEYIVSLQVMENESSIFSLGINVPDEDTAKLICKKWDSNPEEIFSEIIKTLTS